MNFEGVERTFAQRSETGIRLYAHVAIEQIVGILATPEVFILAARGKAVEARDARLQSVGIDAELRGECLQRRRCRPQLTQNLPRLQPVQVHARSEERLVGEE